MKVCTHNDLHAAMPGTAKQIAERLGVSDSRVRTMLKQVDSYVSDWVPDARNVPIPVYSLGTGIDVPRPPNIEKNWYALPPLERKRINRERLIVKRHGKPPPLPKQAPPVQRTEPASPFDLLFYSKPTLTQERVAWLNRELEEDNEEV